LEWALGNIQKLKALVSTGSGGEGERRRIAILEGLIGVLEEEGAGIGEKRSREVISGAARLEELCTAIGTMDERRTRVYKRFCGAGRWLEQVRGEVCRTQPMAITEDGITRAELEEKYGGGSMGGGTSGGMGSRWIRCFLVRLRWNF